MTIQNKRLYSLLEGFAMFESWTVRRGEVAIPRKLTLLAGALLVFTVIFSSFKLVANDENLVVTRFGKLARIDGPGLDFKFPWPIESATKVVVTKIQQFPIGFRFETPKDPNDVKVVETESQMLTTDMNIVDLDLVVQFRVSDPAKWLFKAEEPEDALKSIILTASRAVVAGENFDDVTTTGRAKIQLEVEELSRKIADYLDFGGYITAVQLQDSHPPGEVLPEFQDVNTALEDKQRKIQEANSIKNEKLPAARAQAQQVLEQTAAYATERVNAAQGDVAQFLAVAAEYQKNPTLMRERMRQEVLEIILAGKEQKILADKGDILKLLNVK